MNFISTIIAAICMSCAAPAPGVAQPDHPELECFASKKQAWDAHPGAHLYKHRIPGGKCYHIGPRNHSGGYAVAKASPSQVGATFTATGPTKQTKDDWGKGAKNHLNDELRFLDYRREMEWQSKWWMRN